MDARTFAYQALCEICIHQAYANLYLKKNLNEVEPLQQSFASALVYGTLQNSLYLEYQYEHLLKKKCKDEIKVLLNMSIYQLLFMNEKEYAVVNECVKLAKPFGKATQGFLNAILRQVIKQGKRPLPDDELEACSIQTSHPLWILKMWSAQYGLETAIKIAQANQEVQPLCVRINTLQIKRDELDVTKFKPTTLSKDGAYYLGKDLFNDPLFLEGKVIVQNESSQMVALFLDPQPNEIILDCCSAPGSKAMHMAALMGDTGRIDCGDIHESRVELIKQQALKLGLNSINAKCMDASDPTCSQLYDKILCDVPCSGYGVLGNKSDIKYRMASSDMDTLIPIQASILQASANKLKPQGILVYSTCTLNKKENEKQIEKFLKQNDNFKLIEEKTIFPFEYGSDGFYMAKLQKIA